MVRVDLPNGENPKVLIENEPESASWLEGRAQVLVDQKQFKEAIKYFNESQFEDWQERTLYCHYKLKDFEIFKEKFQLRTILALQLIIKPELLLNLKSKEMNRKRFLLIPL